MFTLHVDLGQVLIMAFMTVIGYFVKMTIDDFKKALERHEDKIFKLSGDVQRLIGQNTPWNGIYERRKS